MANLRKIILELRCSLISIEEMKPQNFVIAIIYEYFYRYGVLLHL